MIKEDKLERIEDRLKSFEEQRRQVREMERALAVLTPAERLVLDRLVIHKERGAAQALCQLLEVEPATVYRYKKQALGKLEKALDNGEWRIEN